jgi:hypothetical protein
MTAAIIKYPLTFFQYDKSYHKKNHHSTPGCHGGQFPLALVGEIINKTPTF